MLGDLRLNTILDEVKGIVDALHTMANAWVVPNRNWAEVVNMKAQQEKEKMQGMTDCEKAQADALIEMRGYIQRYYDSLVDRRGAGYKECERELHDFKLHFERFLE
jgi:hypothetical protein